MSRDIPNRRVQAYDRALQDDPSLAPLIKAVELAGQGPLIEPEPVVFPQRLYDLSAVFSG